MELKDTKSSEPNTIPEKKYPAVRALVSYTLNNPNNYTPPMKETKIVDDLEEWFELNNSDPTCDCFIHVAIRLDSDRDLLEKLLEKWD